MAKTTSKVKTEYELRYIVCDGNISAVFTTSTNKAELIDTAKFLSSKENNRIYFIKRVRTDIIFIVGKHK
jgi:hypothetical protein